MRVIVEGDWRVFTALWGIYCPLGYLLPFGVFTALWGIYCPLGYLLPFGVFTALWGI